MSLNFSCPRYPGSPGVIVLVLALVLLAGCDKPKEPAVLARVGARAITLEDFAAEVQWYQKDGRDLPEREVLLTRMIERELAVQKAKALGLDRDPEVRRAYDALLGESLKERELKPRLKVEVSAQEVQAFYQTNRARYTRPGKTRLAMILVKVDAKASAEKQQEAEARILQARREAETLPSLTNGFGRIALEFSEDQVSRYKGGDLGWFDESMPEFRVPAEVVSAGLALNMGHLSQIIKTKGGLYLVTKLDTRESTVFPFPQVQESIRRQLLAQKLRQIETAYESQLSAWRPVQTNLQALTQFPYPAAKATASNGQPPRLPHSD